MVGNEVELKSTSRPTGPEESHVQQLSLVRTEPERDDTADGDVCQ